MILVTLGTQDKSFNRILKKIDKLIDEGIITEQVIVQAGYTKYESKNMEIFSLTSQDEMDKLVDNCSLLITHGGVGSIFSALKKDKKVIAVARLSKYDEHTNDHQLEVVKEFDSEGYIIDGTNLNKLEENIKKAKTFKPKKYKSNKDNMVNLVDKYIENNNATGLLGLFNKYKELIMYLIFGVLTTLVNILVFYILDKLGVNVYVNNTIAWISSVTFAFITNKLYVFNSKDTSFKKIVKEGVSFYGFRLLSYGFDMLIMFIMVDMLNINKMISKICANIFVIIINYVFSKLFIFKKEEK